MQRHEATIGVFGIPQDEDGLGLWSKRADGKGINAIGGQVDPKDATNTRTLFEVLKREFLEEANLEIELAEERPLGVFPIANLGDIAILLNVRIVSGEPKPSDEATEHIWMSPHEIVEAARKYDNGDKSNGLLSGTGKRQYQMAEAFFHHGSKETSYQDLMQTLQESPDEDESDWNSKSCPKCGTVNEWKGVNYAGIECSNCGFFIETSPQ